MDGNNQVSWVFFWDGSGLVSQGIIFVDILLVLLMETGGKLELFLTEMLRMSLKFESQFQRGILSFIEKISCELWAVTRILKF